MITQKEAVAKVGTVVTGDDGKRYRYIRISESAHKKEFHLKVRNITYHRLELVQIDENGEIAKDKNGKAIHAKAGICAQADFLKKTSMSISLFSMAVYEWLNLKMPLNRVAAHFKDLGVPYTRQQLYSYVDIADKMLQPLFNHMVKRSIEKAKMIGIDETYYACNEKIDKRKEENEKQSQDSQERKKQRSKAVTRRSYLMAIVVDKKACLYFHSCERDTEVIKDILINSGVCGECFVSSDGYYRNNFCKACDGSSELFNHGLCWVHAKRYCCEIVNYATNPDGSVIKSLKN